MSTVFVKATPRVTYTVEMDIRAVYAVQRGLTWALEKGNWATDDAVREVADVFNRIAEDSVERSEFLKSSATFESKPAPEVVKPVEVTPPPPPDLPPAPPLANNGSGNLMLAPDEVDPDDDE